MGTAFCKKLKIDGISRGVYDENNFFPVVKLGYCLIRCEQKNEAQYISDFERSIGFPRAVYKAQYIPASFVCTVKLVAMDRFTRHKQACIDKVVASVIRSPFLVKYYCCFCAKVGSFPICLPKRVYQSGARPRIANQVLMPIFRQPSRCCQLCRPGRVAGSYRNWF